jgi:transposase
VGCPTPAPQLVCHADVRAVNEPTARLQRLAPALTAHVQPWRLAPGVDAFQARRGVPCTVAVTRVADRGDLTRVENPRQRMHDRGFTPAEDSTGARRRQGGMPKTGTTQARRARLEGAWASREPAKVSRQRQCRMEKGPKPLQALRWKAPVRVGTRDRPLSARGQHANQVVVALARGLRALMGAMAQEVPLTPATEPLARPAAVLAQ